VDLLSDSYLPKVREHLMPDKIGRTPPRYSPNTILEVSEHKTFSLRIPTAKFALQILRWLLTKFYSRGRKYTETEHVIVYLLAEYLENYRDRRFLDTHKLLLLKLRLLTNLSLKPVLKHYEKRQEEILLSQRILFSPRAFLSLPADFALKFLSVKDRRRKKDHAPLRRIGVGYRDKGAAKFPAIDGSPSWQEVASAPIDPELTVYDDIRLGRFVHVWEVTKFLLPPSG
jgi:hypothetical protein